MLSHGGHGGWTDPLMRRLSRSFRAWPCGGGFLGFRFASPQAILKRSFAAEGAGTNALEKRKRDRGKRKRDGSKSRRFFTSLETLDATLNIGSGFWFAGVTNLMAQPHQPEKAYFKDD